MDATRKLSIVAGVLFIVATVASVMSTVLLPALTGSGYLTGVAQHSDKMASALLLSLVAAGCSVGIAIALYPVLEESDPALALGSVVFRTIEAVFYTVGVVALLSVSSISQQSLRASAPVRAAQLVVSDSLVASHDHAAIAAVLAFVTGGLLYYVAFYRSGLVPRWLSGWGIAAMPLMTLACLLALFHDQPVTGYVLLALPIGVQEMVFAVWLIAKGFTPTAAHPPVRPTEVRGATTG